MSFRANRSQSNSKSNLTSGIMSSWKGFLALTLFFVAISLIFKWVANPISKRNNPSQQIVFVANDTLVAKIAKNFRLPQQQVRSLLGLQHRYKVLNSTLKTSVDSVNCLIDSVNAEKNSLALSKLKIALLNLDINLTENRYHFYASVKAACSKEDAAELLSALDVNN